jgi:hypothetical protein
LITCPVPGDLLHDFDGKVGDFGNKKMDENDRFTVTDETIKKDISFVECSCKE